MARQVKEYVTDAGEVRFRVRYRLNGREHSETFRRREDARMFRDLLGNGAAERVAEALRWLDARRAMGSGDVLTFGAWFDTYKRSLTGVTARTLDDYEAQRRRYLGSIDALPLELITRIHVADLVNDLDRRGLSPKTIRNVVHLLSSVMGFAVDEQKIHRNPVRRVRLPSAAADATEPKFLTYEEAGALIAATPEHYQPLVAFLFGTGLRWSEATALQARHVDLAAGTVRVQRAWKRIPGGWEVGPPKSKAANRTINAAVPALVAVAPLLGKPGDLVFTTPRGNVVRHANFYNRIWVPACEKAELDPRPTIHATRHTFASWLISEGIGLEAVQDQLGHESYETTRKVYAKLLPAVGVAAGKAASLAMERVLADHAGRGHSALPMRATEGPDQVGDTDRVELDVKRGGQG